MRAPGPTTTRTMMAIRMDYDEDGRLRGWTTTRTIRMDGNEDGRPGWTTTKTEDRRLKTEDR
ncbi:hypothetical protein TYRP_018433 [Tyrophagus putrescentiae]|nr:hypothetical protein TYRP_018433 [Tyrophagus putrescentiae]